MKISYNWLQSFFLARGGQVKKMPKPEKLAEVLTIHSFEVESVLEVRLPSGKSDFQLNIDILPNRAHDCLCHLGVAKEISAILDLKIKLPKLTKVKPLLKQRFDLCVSEPDLCRRYVGRIIEGVKVGQSPEWMKERLEAIGQKTINNIVDATNYAMFEFGQPMHIFDADKVEGKIIIRKAKKGEKIITLDNQEFELNDDALVIADDKGVLAIAGIKGGKKAEIDVGTKNIILEAANFESLNIRKTARRLNLRTESSLRFENELSSETALAAMERLTGLILETAGGKATAKIDLYPKKANQYKIGIHPRDFEKLLGVVILEKEIINILKSLGFELKKINPLKNILALAKSLIGKPYKYGASVSFDAPNAFDCSSFAAYVFAHSGIQIPRMTIDQYFFGELVDKKEIQPGDMIFSNTKIGKARYKSLEFMKGLKIKEGIDHCGIYLGNGKIIHSSRYNSRGVLIENMKTSKRFKNVVAIKRMFNSGDDLLIVGVPFERLDVRRKEDLIEEVARIYGYENIKPKIPEGTLVPAKRNDNYFYVDIVRNILVGLGFSEVYNYSFSEKGEMELQNPIAKDKAFLRTNLLDGLYANIRDNSRYVDKIKIFEVGKIFSSGGEILSFAGAFNDSDFNEIKGVVSVILQKIGISDFYFAEHANKTADIKIGDTSVGYIDNFAQSWGWEINFEELVKLASEEMEYRPISVYPVASRDIAVFVSLKTKVIEVLDVIENTAGELLVDTDLFDIFEKDDRKSFAFHLKFQSHEKTLSDNEINAIMEKIFEAIESNPEWEVRKQKG
jgi:phenylalanyl-tRNA synthetase beta subunit